LFLVLSSTAVAGAETLVIAHRGASAYLPEHTLPAVAMAHAMGADYIEQDVVLTRDNKLVVMHDLTLDHTTDVAHLFPGRARDDGHFYAIDFDLAEIKQLRVNERRDDEGRPVFPTRFPIDSQLLGVPTLAEEIELIQGLNRSTGRDVGLHVELKKPAFHTKAGKDLSAIVLQELYRYGYRDADDSVYIQCFDADTLKELRANTDIRLVQLLEDVELSAARAMIIADYADGVGPSIKDLVNTPEFVSAAQEAGLKVHAYTFRADQLLEGFESFDSMLDYFIGQMSLNGFFTDHPDLARRYVDKAQ
jgi:glycerophosphoryl diester phosphodiesterase